VVVDTTAAVVVEAVDVGALLGAATEVAPEEQPAASSPAARTPASRFTSAAAS